MTNSYDLLNLRAGLLSVRCTLAICCLVALTASCSEPPAIPPQAAPAKPASEPLVAETPAVEIQVDDQSAETPPAETSPLEKLPVERTSPLEVGEQAPNFRLQDQTGTDRTLDGLLADGKVALVFYRSADW